MEPSHRARGQPTKLTRADSRGYGRLRKGGGVGRSGQAWRQPRCHPRSETPEMAIRHRRGRFGPAARVSASARGTGQGTAGWAAKVAGLGVGTPTGARDNRSRLQRLARGILFGCTSGGNAGGCLEIVVGGDPSPLTRRVTQRRRKWCPRREAFFRHEQDERGSPGRKARSSQLKTLWVGRLAVPNRLRAQRTLVRWHSARCLFGGNGASGSRSGRPGSAPTRDRECQNPRERLGSPSQEAQGVGGTNDSSTSRRSHAAKLSRLKTALSGAGFRGANHGPRSGSRRRTMMPACAASASAEVHIGPTSR